MLLLIGALTIGLILSLLAMGVFISFRIFEFPDITADGSITLGGAVAAVLLVAHVHPVLAMVCGVILAGGVHAVKATARPVITATTAGVANPIVSAAEDVVSAVTSLIAVLVPLLAVFLVLGAALTVLLWRGSRARRAQG